MSRSAFFEGGKGSLQGRFALGTGAVSDVTSALGCIPKKCKVTSVRAYQQADITGTGLTLDVIARTTAGAAGATLLASVISLDVADAAAGKAGQSGTLTATPANLALAEGQLIECVFDATSVTAGPGDVIVEVEYSPIL